MLRLQRGKKSKEPLEQQQMYGEIIWSSYRTHPVICCQCGKPGLFAKQREMCMYLFIKADNNRSEPVVKLQAGPGTLVILADVAKAAPEYSECNPLTLIIADKCRHWVWGQEAATSSLRWNSWILRIPREVGQWDFTIHEVMPQWFPGSSLFHSS